ncbi:MAG TPA: carbon storage regulator [Pirellulales bacterium]|nr:carbon storage regulator [Pirellulales bacterium]
MLVLSRKQSERIRLGKDIVVTVVRVAGDKVRLGIEAPADMLVLRDELETSLSPGHSKDPGHEMALLQSFKNEPASE